jgi:hypothetical protein
MAKGIALTSAEVTALAAVDGTPAQPQMLPEINARLMGLCLVERREWPGGPLWAVGIACGRSPIDASLFAQFGS